MLRIYKIWSRFATEKFNKNTINVVVTWNQIRIDLGGKLLKKLNFVFFCIKIILLYILHVNNKVNNYMITKVGDQIFLEF